MKNNVEIDKLNYKIAAQRWVFDQIVSELEHIYTREDLSDTRKFALHIKDEVAKTEDVAKTMRRVCEASKIYITGNRSIKDLTELCYAVDQMNSLTLLAAGESDETNQ